MTTIYSDQLDLFELEVAALPWRGVSPRALTKGARSLFFSQEAQKADRFFVDADQVDLFLEAKRGPPRYEGAPSLFEHLLEGGSNG